MVNLIFFIALALIAILGVVQGFNRTLKFYFRGIFGWIITVFLCITLGGMIRNIPFVANWLVELNKTLTKAASFLSGWATVAIYYIVLFVVISVIKLIFTKMLIGLFSGKNGFIKFLNKALGLVFAVAMAFLFMWLAISVIGMFKNGEILDDLYTKLLEKGGSIFVKILKWNPLQGLFAA